MNFGGLELPHIYDRVLIAAPPSGRDANSQSEEVHWTEWTKVSQGEPNYCLWQMNSLVLLSYQTDESLWRTLKYFQKRMILAPYIQQVVYCFLKVEWSFYYRFAAGAFCIFRKRCTTFYNRYPYIVYYTIANEPGTVLILLP